MLWHKVQGAGGAGGEVILLSDTFTDSNNTPIADHTPDFQAVSASYRTVQTFSTNTSVQIISNTVRGTRAAITTAVAVINCGESDVTVSADVNKNNTATVLGGTGIAFRFTGNTGYFADLVDGTIRLARTNGTTIESQTSASLTYTNTATYNIKAVLSGSSIKIYVDDVLYLDVTDGTYLGTDHGVSVVTQNSTTRSWADNLLVVT